MLKGSGTFFTGSFCEVAIAKTYKSILHFYYTALAVKDQDYVPKNFYRIEIDTVVNRNTECSPFLPRGRRKAIRAISLTVGESFYGSRAATQFVLTSEEKSAIMRY